MNAFRDGWKHALTESLALPAAGTLVPPGLPGAKAAPIAAETAHQEPPVAAPLAKKGFNWTPMAVGIPICLVIFCLTLAFLLPGRLFNRLQAAARSTETPQASETPPPAATSAPPTGKHTSWAAANTIYSIGFHGDEVLAGGPGGITVWNRNDGSYRQFTTADGLPSANVDAVFVDKDQSIWVGTDAGLVHASGDERTFYTSDQGLDSNYIVAIARVGERLFAGSQYSGVAGGGLLEFNPNNPGTSGKTWKPVPGFPSSENPGQGAVSYNVRQIVADQKGSLWVATDQGVAMLGGNGQWNVFKTESGLPDNSVYTIYPDTKGELWVGTSTGGVAKFNRGKGAFESFADLSNLGVYDVYSILQSADGNFWFSGGNVARYDPATDKWAGVSTDGSLPVNSVLSAGMDDQGTLYFGTDQNGLARYANGKLDVALVPKAPRFAQYGHIIPAPDGKLIFVQLFESGADQFDPADESWTKLPPDQHVPRVFDALGQMWSGGWDGLWIFNADKTTAVSTDHGLPSNQVNGIAFSPDGNAYIATNAGIAVFDGLHITDVYTAAKDGLASDEVSNLFVASDGSLWASDKAGFSRRLPDGTWQHFTSQALFGSAENYFAKFAEDREHNIWIATGNDGLYRFSNGEWKRLISTDPGVGLPSDYITCVTIAPDGALWLGSDGQGAVRYDGKTWQRYRAEDGLIDQHIYDIYIDANGVIWFATSGGITRLRP